MQQYALFPYNSKREIMYSVIDLFDEDQRNFVVVLWEMSPKKNGVCRHVSTPTQVSMWKRWIVCENWMNESVYLSVTLSHAYVAEDVNNCLCIFMA